MARLAFVDNKKQQVIQRRITIDKSADRWRHALTAVAWDTILVQWIHTTLMEFLPTSYLTAYLDIMQALKYKLPSLVDKMIFWRPGNVNQDLLAPILKRPWQPALNNKYRKLPGNTLLVVIPSLPKGPTQPSRVQKLFTLFTTMAPMLPIQLNVNNVAAQKQNLQSIAEQLVSITRIKINELKAENPDRRLILVGMNCTSALALQVALVEQVSGVICFGFSYNTVHGVRGQPDDNILDVTAPTLFVIGQNAARSSEEEIETFRERFSAPTSLVVVGSADDYLRVSKTKRKLEGVTQEMVDNIIVDEMADFATACLQRPLTKLKNAAIINSQGAHGPKQIDSTNEKPRKRKTSQMIDGEGLKKTPKISKAMRATSTTTTTASLSGSSEDALEMAVQSILPDIKNKPSAVLKPAPPQGKLAQTVRYATISGGQKMKIMPHSTTFKTQQSFINQPQKFVTLTKTIGPSRNFIQIPVSQAKSRPASCQSGCSSASNSRPSTPTSQQQQIINFTNRPARIVGQQSFSPTKYTIVKTTVHSMNNSNIISTPSTSYISESTDTDMSNANIFDMPVVFADNEGNIDDDNSVMSEGSFNEMPSDESSSVVGNKIILRSSDIGPSSSSSATISFKNRGVVIQKPTINKTLMINGKAIKAVPATSFFIPKISQPLKFVGKIVPAQKPTTNLGKKIEILSSQLIKPALIPSSTAKSGNIKNISDTRPLTGTRLTLPASMASPQLLQNLKPTQIVIKSNSLKPYTGQQIGNMTIKRISAVPSADNQDSTASVFKKT